MSRTSDFSFTECLMLFYFKEYLRMKDLGISIT